MTGPPRSIESYQPQWTSPIGVSASRKYGFRSSSGVPSSMPETTAFAAVILYRLASFYVPPIWGFFALRWLEKTKQL